MANHEGLNIFPKDTVQTGIPITLLNKNADYSLPAISGIDRMDVASDRHKRSQSRKQAHRNWEQGHANTSKVDKHPVPQNFNRRGQPQKPH